MLLNWSHLGSSGLDLFGGEKPSAKVGFSLLHVKCSFVLLLDRCILLRLNARKQREEKGAHIGEVSFECQVLSLVSSLLPQGKNLIFTQPFQADTVDSLTN